MSNCKMTRVRYKKDIQLTREQIKDVLKQQSHQVILLMNQLDAAYIRIHQLEEENRLLMSEEDEEDEDDEEDEEDEEDAAGSNRQTLLLMDSHVKVIKAKVIEEEIGGRLYTGQFNCDLRVYNSGPWQNAKKPHKNLQASLHRLLRQRTFTHLVLQASCNDITNIRDIKDMSLLFEMAKKSSHNTVKCAVEAFAICPSLRSVLILPRSPRVDDLVLSDISKYGNDALVPAVFETGLSNIKLGSMESIPVSTDSDILNLFGSASNTDFIHMRGARGRDLYTEAILRSLQSNGLSIKTQG